MGCVSKAVSSDSIDFRRTAKEKTKTFCRWSKGYHHRYKAALGGYQSGTGSGKRISRKESLPEQGCVENGERQSRVEHSPFQRYRVERSSQGSPR